MTQPINNEHEAFEAFYKTITPAVPQAGYEDITMDAAYLAWQHQQEKIDEQLCTIKALNLCIGGADSCTLENITHAGEWCKEDETLLDRIDREHNDNLGVLRLLAVERTKVEELDARATKYAFENDVMALRLGQAERQNDDHIAAIGQLKNDLALCQLHNKQLVESLEAASYEVNPRFAKSIDVLLSTKLDLAALEAYCEAKEKVE